MDTQEKAPEKPANGTAAIVKAPANPVGSGTIDAFASASNFESAQRMAKAFATSSLVPEAYRNNVPNVLIAMEAASRIGGLSAGFFHPVVIRNRGGSRRGNDMSERPLIIYHANCADGFTAAWVAYRKFGANADYVPAQYGDKLLYSVLGRDVYVLDFSYPRSVLLALHQQAVSLTVLDHHKTAAVDLAGLDFCTFDMERSGARLAWDHFFPGKPSPWLVDYAEDRDLWRWRLWHSREVNASLASRPRTFDNWSALVDPAFVEDVAKEGSAILRYQAQLVDAICANACEAELDGYKVLSVNSPVLQSEVGEKLAEGRAFSVVWFYARPNTKVYSLRSRPPHGIDVSEVAKRHGGGGHPGAAGFTEVTPPAPTADGAAGGGA